MMRAIVDLSEAVPALLLNLNLVGLLIAGVVALAVQVAGGVRARVKYVLVVCAFISTAVVPFVAGAQLSGSREQAASIATEAEVVTPPTIDGEAAMPRMPVVALSLLAAWIAGAVLLLIDEVRRQLVLRAKRRAWRAGEDAAIPSGVAVFFAENDGPAALGFFRSAIVLPARWMETLGGEARRLIICHELAHVRWRDPAVSTAARIVRAVLWPSLGLWWLERQLCAAREFAADEAAVPRATPEAESYVDCLLAAAAMRRERATEGQLGVFGAGSLLQRRVSHLLFAPSRPIVRAFAAVAIVIVGLAAVMMSPRAAGPHWGAAMLEVRRNTSSDYRRSAAALNAIFVRTRPRDFRADGAVKAQLAVIAAGTLAPVRDAMSSANPVTREAAAWVAGELGHTSLKPSVAMLLNDPDIDVSRAAAWALGRIDEARSAKRGGE